MRARIFMDTTEDAITIAQIAADCEKDVYIEDGSGLKVKARSILGSLYALEFNALWLVSEGDYYTNFRKFIIGDPLNPPAVF